MAITYTYNAEDLATSALARIRRVIGDVDVSNGATTAYFADQEIDSALAIAGDNEGAAAVELLEQLATLYADKATVATGSQRINLSDVSKAFAARAVRLQEKLDVAAGNNGALTSLAVTRVDGYSQTIASDVVTVADQLDPDGRREHYDWPVG